MLHFTDDMLEQVREELLSYIGEKDYFNGVVNSCVEDDNEETYHYTLRTTLLIYRDEWDNIEKILPLYWKFSVEGEEETDFTIFNALNS